MLHYSWKGSSYSLHRSAPAMQHSWPCSKVLQEVLPHQQVLHDDGPQERLVTRAAGGWRDSSLSPGVSTAAADSCESLSCPGRHQSPPPPAHAPSALLLLLSASPAGMVAHSSYACGPSHIAFAPGGHCAEGYPVLSLSGLRRVLLSPALMMTSLEPEE